MCPSLRSFQPTRPTDLIQLGLLFGPDALPKTHSRSTIQHYFTTLHSLTSEDCATLPKATKVKRIVTGQASGLTMQPTAAATFGTAELVNMTFLIGHYLLTSA